jgi:hypothetical protein
MDEETERELIRRLSEKPGGSETPPPDLLAKIVSEIPNPLPVAASRRGWAMPRTQWLRLAAMLILFVGAGFLATRIIPDLNPSHFDRSDATRADHGPDRSTVTQPAAPGAMPAAPPSKPAAQSQKAKAAPSLSRNQPQVVRDEASAEAKRQRSEPEGVASEGAQEQEPGAGTVSETDRLGGEARLAESREQALSRDDARKAEIAKERRVVVTAPVAVPAQKSLQKVEESVPASDAAPQAASDAAPAMAPAPMRAARAPESQNATKDDSGRARSDQTRKKNAVSTGSTVTGALSAAAGRSTNAAPGDASGFVDTARQQRLATGLTDGAAGAVAGLRRALDDGRLLDARTADVDAFLALSPSQTARHGMADEAIHMEGAPTPYGRGPRFFLVLFDLNAAATKDPSEARLEIDPALVSRYRLVGRSLPSVPSEPIRLLYELELRRDPGADDRLLTLEVFSRGGSFTTAIFSGRHLVKRWEQASVDFRFVSLAALLAEQIQGLPAARNVDRAPLVRRLEEIARLRQGDADAQRLVRMAKESASWNFAPEPDVKR